MSSDPSPNALSTRYPSVLYTTMENATIMFLRLRKRDREKRDGAAELPDVPAST